MITKSEVVSFLTYDPKTGEFRSRLNRIGIRGVGKLAGSPSKNGFHTKEEAAIAYDAAAKKYFGKFAKTNKGMGLFK